MTHNKQVPNIAAIRELLLAAFTVEGLRRFCLDQPLFLPLANKFSPDHGLDDLVDRTISYCRTQHLWQELLTEVQKVNPRQYDRYESRLYISAPPPHPGTSPKDVAAFGRWWLVISISVVLLLVVFGGGYFVFGPNLMHTPTKTARIPTDASVSAPGSPPAAACPTPRVFGASDNLDEDMVTIPGTKLLMGDDETAPPRHEVELESFMIDRFEVTNLQYKQFVDEAGHQPPEGWEGTHFPSGSAFHPVVNVTWYDAAAYCAWVGKRLSTEAEWELTCRGEASYQYPWGNEHSPSLANSNQSSCGKVLTVGSFSPEGDTSYGVSDMLGNAAEWTSSISMDYPYQADDGREDLTDMIEYRTIRGGSFTLPLLTCAVRLDGPPEFWKSDVGFRCAKGLPTSP